MDAEGNKRSLVSVIVAAIVVLIVYLLVPATPILPCGIFLPINKALAPIPPTQVTFYNADSAPLAYQKIGYINVQFHTKSVTAEGEKQLEQYIRQLAAKVGANGVVINLFGHTLPGQVPTSQASYVFRGLAVYAVPDI